MTNGRGWAVAIVGILIALIVIAVFAFRDEAPPADEPETDEDFEQWAYEDETPEPRRRGPAEDSEDREESPARRARFEARRAEWQARWRAAVEIVPLGEHEPTLTPDAIREALAPSREQLRQCVHEAGGWRALFEARRALREASPSESPQRGAVSEANPASDGEGWRGRRRSRVSFDVRPDGTVDPASLRFNPPMPEQFAGCFEEHFLSLHLEGAGDGASVELPMGPPGGRRGRFGDGGVRRGRWGRGRRGGGDRRERGGGL